MDIRQLLFHLKKRGIWMASGREVVVPLLLHPSQLYTLRRVRDRGFSTVTLIS